jgi:hypothetical protein
MHKGRNKGRDREGRERKGRGKEDRKEGRIGRNA